MINIPLDNQKDFNQANQSDLFGNISVTKNITFDTEGYLRLSNSPREAMDETIDADFDNPAVILFSSNYGYFVETWDSPFEVNEQILYVRPTQIAGVPLGDIQSDAVWFGGLMPVSQDTDVDYYDPVANAWTDTNITLTNAGQHQEVNFVSLTALAIADVNTVKLYESPLSLTPTLRTTLVIGTDFRITSMCYFNQNLYIGTQHIYGGHAYLIVWNGLGTAAQQFYEVDSNMMFSLCVYQDSVVMLTGNGSLLQFNGGGFNLLAGFPIFYTDQALTDETNVNMYKNIMKANGNLLYILFTNQENDAVRLLSQPDGIWCYDPNIGLYHRYSLSNSLVQPDTIATASVNTTTNQITVARNYVTGTEVYYNDEAGATIPELKDNVKYFVIRIDATHIQLATTLANANAGTPIDLTGTGNNSQKLVFFPNIDYGQYFTNRTFSLNVIERPVANRQYGTELIYGAGVLSRTMADLETLGTVSTGVESRGYFITPKIFSTDVTDMYNKISLKFSPYTSELDKIIIKYRNYDDMRQYVNVSGGITGGWDITWTSINTFTTTEPLWTTAIVGDEVEVLQGAGAGLLAHITAISLVGTTYTITLDDNYDNYVTTDVGKAVFRNWIKWKTISYGDSNALQYFISDQLGKKGKFLQMKIELRGIQTRIEELLIDNTYRLGAKEK
jgi:hypothetical protein